MGTLFGTPKLKKKKTKKKKKTNETDWRVLVAALLVVVAILFTGMVVISIQNAKLTSKLNVEKDLRAKVEKSAEYHIDLANKLLDRIAVWKEEAKNWETEWRKEYNRHQHVKVFVRDSRGRIAALNKELEEVLIELQTTQLELLNQVTFVEELKAENIELIKELAKTEKILKDTATYAVEKDLEIYKLKQDVNYYRGKASRALAKLEKIKKHKIIGTIGGMVVGFFNGWLVTK